MNHYLINYQLTALKKPLVKEDIKTGMHWKGKIRKLEDKAKMEVKKAALWGVFSPLKFKQVLIGYD